MHTPAAPEVQSWLDTAVVALEADGHSAAATALHSLRVVGPPVVTGFYDRRDLEDLLFTLEGPKGAARTVAAHAQGVHDTLVTASGTTALGRIWVYYRPPSPEATALALLPNPDWDLLWTGPVPAAPSTS